MRRFLTCPSILPRGGAFGCSAAGVVLGLALAGGLLRAPTLVGAPASSPPEARDTKRAPDLAGPTLSLGYGGVGPPHILVAEFMYFVPLISPEPVSLINSPGNTQRARLVSATRSSTDRSFAMTCEFEFVGEGKQVNVIDHTDKLRRHERELKGGGSLSHQLGSINVQGAGLVRIEIEGTLREGVSTVTQVKVRFDAHGRPSPVTIGLHDIGYVEGAFRGRNETIARVNTLTFRRSAGVPRMGITVASVKPEGAGDTLWHNMVGGLKGTTVNLFLKPIPVEAAGNDAMLAFGSALVSKAPAFTFPRARNLKTDGL